MVIVPAVALPVKTAVTPGGKPVAVPMPVAIVVVWVMLVNAVLIHKVGVALAAETVLFGFTIICLVVLLLQPLESV